MEPNRKRILNILRRKTVAVAVSPSLAADFLLYFNNVHSIHKRLRIPNGWSEAKAYVASRQREDINNG
jgi:hypothetical protein